MRNQTSPANPDVQNAPTADTTEQPETRRAIRRGRIGRRRLIGIGALVAVGALVGTGFTVKSAADAQARIEATAAVTDATGLHRDQLGAYSTVAAAKAIHSAQDTIAVAQSALQTADGKVDASALASSVASLGEYETMPIDSIVDLTRQTKTQAAEAVAAAAEHDRVVAEQAAAAAAALAAANTPDGAKAFARDLAASQYGWNDSQFQCLVNLWQKESGWNYEAMNASSGAAGIPQSLPGTKMATAGADWQTNAQTQIRWGLGYIAGSYGTPCAAWSHSQSVNWY
ncbi:hypothetical protein [Agromyces sp. LHK192]|uniref:aggregation-promoting factor C-terminal-like domain-containing protein n=1 Tax=Agromyces sp. LHK192 TaxID=2498704 RepID=UPI001F0BFB1E|nr:hypothetical protein [Agromyces sp. LHK192]